MHLSKLEKDILVDLAQDSHELWEIYAFVRYAHPDKQEHEVIAAGRELLGVWIDRGWLKAVRSRTDTNVVSGDELLATVDKLGPQAADPEKGIILLELSEQPARDVDWFSRPKDPKNITDKK